ncbi:MULTISPECIES: RidA family protein [Arthrobacter]|uniref:LysR family transcriptional regulator n=1 Tax=Arthrobacter psychrochitiniphilus TaxID=291045 RepID=A0A2V3DNE0_9MICC|nr:MULTISPECIES: RidA family protein [Arthrobacter]NYG16152.1 enamine deaminase RidA (YjgF/YER057c/UK114 family) [Arthrobacter psychrochitiniphilus]PXA64460.1 LysR family transcriptional regulator [Arthrobacter psychrochitiniphilus]
MTATPTAFSHPILQERLAQLGLTLPETSSAVAAYVPAIRTGNTVYTSGQLPLHEGTMGALGKVGAEVSPEVAKDLARTCVLNALAAAGALGDLDTARILKVTGFVASASGFNGQPAVINGASELLVELFGSRGAHARSAVGVAELPLNAPVEVEIIVEFL